MISIQSAMLVALGFLAASLLGLLVASAFWSRAVRLTTARIKQSMPVSEPEIRADRDRLRAEYAIKVHKLETQLDQAKLERARQLIEINRRDASISTLETDVVQLKADLEENQNARRVLEQTVADRLPRVEARLNEAKRLLFNRDREIAELTAGARRHKQALEEASSINAQQNAQIERLSTALTTRGGRGRQRRRRRRPEGEVALRAEIESLRGKTREQALLIDRLQRRLGHGFALPAPAGTPRHRSAEGEIDACAARHLRGGGRHPARCAPRPPRQTASSARLRARDQGAQGQRAGPGRRDRAAQGGARRLRAAGRQGRRAEGQPDRAQGAARLRPGAGRPADRHHRQARAELAATHERLARQAAHFMGEMRRIGTGGTAPPTAGQARRPARGERARWPSASPRSAHRRRNDGPDRDRAHRARPRRGAQAARSRRSPTVATGARREKPSPASSSPSGDTAAAEMPKAPEIPEQAPSAAPARPHHRSGQGLTGPRAHRRGAGCWRARGGIVPAAGQEPDTSRTSLRGLRRLAGAGSRNACRGPDAGRRSFAGRRRGRQSFAAA